MNKETREALVQWVSHPTWRTNHWADEGRFFDFVQAAWNENHKIWDESSVREIMITEAKRFHQKLPDDQIAKFVDEMRSKGTLILDYLKHCQEKIA